MTNTKNMTKYDKYDRVAALGFSSTQLWRVGFCCQNRSKNAVMKLGTTLERTGFCSCCVGLCSTPTRRGG